MMYGVRASWLVRSSNSSEWCRSLKITHFVPRFTFITVDFLGPDLLTACASANPLLVLTQFCQDLLKKNPQCNIIIITIIIINYIYIVLFFFSKHSNPSILSEALKALYIGLSPHPNQCSASTWMMQRQPYCAECSPHTSLLVERRQSDEANQQIWGLLGSHDDQRAMGKFGQEAEVTPILFAKDILGFLMTTEIVRTSV